MKIRLLISNQFNSKIRNYREHFWLNHDTGWTRYRNKKKHNISKSSSIIASSEGRYINVMMKIRLLIFVRFNSNIRNDRKCFDEIMILDGYVIKVKKKRKSKITFPDDLQRSYHLTDMLHISNGGYTLINLHSV